MVGLEGEIKAGWFLSRICWDYWLCRKVHIVIPENAFSFDNWCFCELHSKLRLSGWPIYSILEHMINNHNYIFIYALTCLSWFLHPWTFFVIIININITYYGINTVNLAVRDARKPVYHSVSYLKIKSIV